MSAVPKMVARVRAWLEAGVNVRIFTARAAEPSSPESLDFVRRWCAEHIGAELPVTATKDYKMIHMWDDRAVQVVPNTGERADGLVDV